MEGLKDGEEVGFTLGTNVGVFDGIKGLIEGENVGLLVGKNDGVLVGQNVDGE